MGPFASAAAACLRNALAISISRSVPLTCYAGRGWGGGPYIPQVAQQMVGLTFGEGGPVISVQLDNETPNVEYVALPHR